MLRSALASVVEQTYPNIELIFVDNNSTDGSADVAREVLTASGRAFRLATCPVQGANNARNHGYGFARGDYIQWMDADDAMDRDKIERQVRALEADAAAHIAYGDWSGHRMLPGQPESVQRFQLRQVDDQVQRTLAGIWYPPHSYLLRRAAADRLQVEQAWWPDRSVSTDVEYSTLAAMLGLRFRYVAGAHVRYNVWSEAQTSNATPYAQRVANLAAIHQRLRRFVASGLARAVIAADHRMLLHQDWTPCHISPDATTLVELPGQRFALERRDGWRIELNADEADVARAMMSATPMAPCHLALALAAIIPRMADQHVAIARTIEWFRREGFLAMNG
jgi:hypothetical protein